MKESSKRSLDESSSRGGPDHASASNKQPRLDAFLTGTRPDSSSSSTTTTTSTSIPVAPVLSRPSPTTAGEHHHNNNITNNHNNNNNDLDQRDIARPAAHLAVSTNSSNEPVVIEVPSSDDEELTSSNNNNNKNNKNINESHAIRKNQKVRKVDGEWIFPEFTRDQTSQARRYLHSEGTLKFLERYLPPTPTAADLLTIIILLGFNSVRLSKDMANTNDDEERFLMYTVGLLRKAMDKVFSSRTRLGTVNTIEDALDQIRKAKKILVITGAGISTSLGIPDFRSARGIYANLPDLAGVDDPQDVFNLAMFREDPGVFYSVAHMILPPPDVYTPLHVFIKLLNDKGKLLRNYTQNIDNIEENVGIPEDKIIQCHGSFARATCQTCKWECKGSVISKYIKSQELPICKFCGPERRKRFKKNPDYQPRSYGVVKPNITFFGEDLPARYHDNILQDAQNCDLLISIGTSLKVQPVCDIVNKVSPDVPQILINKDMINHTEFDISFLGYCDDVASYLCNKLGWRINHENYDKIINAGLDLEELDEEVGIFQITGHWKNNNEISNKLQDEPKPKPPVVVENEVGSDSNSD